MQKLQHELPPGCNCYIKIHPEDQETIKQNIDLCVISYVARKDFATS